MPLKKIPRCERKGKLGRVYSTNFPLQMKQSGIKCYVPWEDYLSLKIRYEKLCKKQKYNK